MGAHDAAKGMRLVGDQAADALGADVAEKQLGETEFAFELVHGDVNAINETVGHLRKFAEAFGETARGLAEIDTAHWKGKAADAFRAVYHQHPRQWADAESACQQAADAWESYAHTVDWAQHQAQQALRLYQDGRRASEQAHAEYDAQVASYNADVAVYNTAISLGGTPERPPQKPGPFTDPGQARMREAQEILDRARQQRDQAAARAQDTIVAATNLAPAEPSFGRRMLADAKDLYEGGAIEQEHFLGGVVKATGDIVKLARTLNPQDYYNVTHPAEYLDGVSTTAAGLVHSAHHPVELVKGLVGTGWSSDPSEALGKLTANVVLGAVTDGGGAAAKAGASIAERAAAGATERAAAGATERAAAGATERAAAGATERAAAGATERAATTGAEDAARTAAADAAKSATEHAGTAGAQDTAHTAAGDAGHAIPTDAKPPSLYQPPPDLDQQIAHHLDQSGGGLGKVESDLQNLHVHDPGTTTTSSAGTVDTAPAPHSVHRPPNVSAPHEPTPPSLITQKLDGTFHKAEQELADLKVGEADSSGVEHHSPDVVDRRGNRYSLSQEDREYAQSRRRDVHTGKEIPELRPLTDEQLYVIADYKGSGYKEINEALRAGDPDALERLAPKIETLESSIEKMPRYKGETYRGIAVRQADLDDLLARYEIGKTVREPAFTSTSPDSPYHGNVMFVVDSTNGRDISCLGEHEVVYPPDYEFTVTDKYFDEESWTWVIHLAD
nr:ADP-ribosyltransferase [Gandjariella thermophila]